MKKRTIYLVSTYTDGALVAYDTEKDALEAKDTYHDSGLYFHEDTYVEELYFIEDN